MAVMTLSKVAEPNSIVKAMQSNWDMLMALFGGTSAMRAKGETYLPKFPKEKPDAYKRRLAVSTLFPAFKRTVSTLVGKPFSKDVTLSDDMPEQVKLYMQDVDREGRDINVFGADLLTAALGMGLAGILVDYPQRGDIPNTIAAEQEAGLRPYFVKINATQLLGWKYTTDKSGKITLTQLRFKEIVNDDSASEEFGESAVEQIRVIEQKRTRIFRKVTGQLTDWVQFGDDIPNTLGIVPFVPVYGEYMHFMCGRTPLLELAFLNVKHWQSQSDQDNILHVARVPILAIQTDDDKFEFDVGSSAAVRVPQGTLMPVFVEHSGKAIEAGASSLKDLEEQMRQSGAELLVLRDVQATATEVATDDSIGMCDLQRMVNMLQDSLNSALVLMGKWEKNDKPGTLKLYNDFGFSTLGEASASLVKALNDSEIISDETLVNEYQRRGILQASVKVKDEQAKIAAQPVKPKVQREQDNLKAAAAAKSKQKPPVAA